MPLPILNNQWDETLIQKVATDLGLTLSFPEQMRYLESLESLDVQAAPGCGKTTLTGAKLCALAQLWQSNVQGICVLSHTNVAKNEIISMLSQHNYGRRMLSFPHFIGTIQSFVDTFLAIPSLRNREVEVHSIDDEVYARKAEARFGWQYPQLKGLAQRQQNINAHVKTATYFFRDEKLVVDALGGTLPFGVNTPSYTQYEKLKNDMLADGVFRYSDMYGFAMEYMNGYPLVIDALRHRFPLVIIDEAQDTNNIQDTLLNWLFASDCVVIQRIGDVNQSIFGEDIPSGGKASFPRDSKLNLPQTMRFGHEIACYASKLTLVSKQSIEGCASHITHPPALIMFDKASAQQVTSEFGRLIDECVPQDDLKKYGAKVLGARKQSSTKSYPCTLQDYCPGYLAGSSSMRSSSLGDACYQAQAVAGTNKNYSQASEYLWEAFQQALLYSGVKIRGKRPTRKRIVEALADNGVAELQALKRAMYDLSFLVHDDPKKWEARVDDLFKNSTLQGTKTQEFTEYCKYLSKPIETRDPSKEASETKETFQVSTIHGAKGETHAATLIVECCSNRIFDIKEVLPIFVGKHDPKRIDIQTVQEHIKSVFVGMTRARSLVAFAIFKEHISQDIIDELIGAGWSVVDLTCSL